MAQLDERERERLRQELCKLLAKLQRRFRYYVPDPPSRFVGVPFVRLHVPRRRPGSAPPGRE